MCVTHARLWVRGTEPCLGRLAPEPDTVSRLASVNPNWCRLLPQTIPHVSISETQGVFDLVGQLLSRKTQMRVQARYSRSRKLILPTHWTQGWIRIGSCRCMLRWLPNVRIGLGYSYFKPKFHLARHVTSRHDSTRSTCRASRDERVDRVEPCCSNMADDEQAIVLACTYTTPICSVKYNKLGLNKCIFQ